MSSYQTFITEHIITPFYIYIKHFLNSNLTMRNNKISVVDLFEKSKVNDTYVKVCAPMVRYSKVQFRSLVRSYGVQLCFTPMILADSFCQNAKARSSEFVTTNLDSPLVVQFAANNVDDFIDAAKLVYPYADGVDLNCGCPQSWAMKDGYGAALLSKPEKVHDLVKSVRNNMPNNFSISVKIRLMKELKKTIDLCKQLEKCGVSFLTVHGRTPAQKSAGDVDLIALKEVCQSVQVPVIANGGVKTLSQAENVFEAVNCSGVMAASALLTNPALFSGANRTPLDCIQLWVRIKNSNPKSITFQCYHHHLVFMLDKILTKEQKQAFNSLKTFDSVDEYLYKNIISSDTDITDCLGDFVACQYPDEITMKHSKKCRGCSKSVCYCTCVKYDCNSSDGNFFTTYVKEHDDLDYMDSNIFDED